MELYRLNSDFELERPIEDFQSLIWTERYAKNGDFELITSEIEKTINLLPRDSVLGLRDSLTPMIVEDYLIEHNKGRAPTIKVTGRTYDTVLERRSSMVVFPEILGSGGVPIWYGYADKESDMAFGLVSVILGIDERPEHSIPGYDPSVAPEDAIPELYLVTPQDYVPGGLPTQKKIDIPKTDLYSAVTQLISVNHHGVRVSRPLDGRSVVDFEIYNGADIRDDVVFDARHEQLEDTRYLLSAKGSANVAYVYSEESTSIFNKNSGPTPAGLSRRVIAFEGPTEGSGLDEELRRSAALVELYKRNATASFDGEISTLVAEGYNRDYFLGDIVTLFGSYGMTQAARISEFVRAKDSSGTRYYPALEVINE